ncbi:MAG: class I SAM-dependent methyltransferase [Actinobacteria bacterium]|nr:class I SAM-dependent methyltransferase [Actinomycetota bacterium]
MAVQTASARLHDPRSITPVDLAAAVGQSLGYVERAARARARRVAATHGGDPVPWRSRRNLERHVANYLVAAWFGAGATGVHRYLDVGCGIGALAAWIADRLDASLAAVDTDPLMRTIAARTAPDAQVLERIDRAPTADLVTALEVVEHLARGDQHRFVATLFARVRPGGQLVISTPDESAYPFGDSGYRPHVGCLDAASLHQLLRRATGQHVEIWHLDGGPFTARRGRLLAEWVANHLWATIAAGPVEALVRRLVRRTRTIPSAPTADQLGTIVLRPHSVASEPAGTGLIARVTKPLPDGHEATLT